MLGRWKQPADGRNRGCRLGELALSDVLGDLLLDRLENAFHIGCERQAALGEGQHPMATVTRANLPCHIAELVELVEEGVELLLRHPDPLGQLSGAQAMEAWEHEEREVHR